MRPHWILLLCILSPSLALADGITITRSDPLIERKTFDPANRPSDMPKLDPNESAVTQSFFGADTRVGGEIIDRKQVDGGYEATIKVDSVRMTLQMRATLWLPKNSNPKLTRHEEGHQKLAEHYYKDAESIARSLAQEMIGQTIRGRGPDAEAAAANALKDAAQVLGGKYMGRTDVPCGAAQDHYDQITAHGTNAIPEDRAAAQAISRVTASETTVSITGGGSR